MLRRASTCVDDSVVDLNTPLANVSGGRHASVLAHRMSLLGSGAGAKRMSLLATRRSSLAVADVAASTSASTATTSQRKQTATEYDPLQLISNMALGGSGIASRRTTNMRKEMVEAQQNTMQADKHAFAESSSSESESEDVKAAKAHAISRVQEITQEAEENLDASGALDLTNVKFSKNGMKCR